MPPGTTKFARARRGNERPVIVHDVAHAVAALTAALHCGCPVVLLSPPDGARYLGAPLFGAIVGLARRARPNVRSTAVLDCGTDAGRVLDARRHAIDAVIFRGPASVRNRLAATLARSRLHLFDRLPPALDLRGTDDPLAACRAWFTAGCASDTRNPSSDRPAGTVPAATIRNRSR